MFLSHLESRTLIGITSGLYIMSGFADLGFVRGWNASLGIEDTTWLMFGSTAIESLRFGIGMLAPFVLISKITPAHVEATVFSFAASVISMTFLIGKMTAITWNYFFFHVDAENMENLYKLNILQICLGFFSLLYLPLIPTWEAIAKVQEKLKQLNSDQEVDLR